MGLGAWAWRPTFRQLQSEPPWPTPESPGWRPPWPTPEACFQSSRAGGQWGWGRGHGFVEVCGVNWGSDENWRWQHCDRVPTSWDLAQQQQGRVHNAIDMRPHGASLQPSYPHWGEQLDWQCDGTPWDQVAQQQQYLQSLPNDCFQQSSYSTP